MESTAEEIREWIAAEWSQKLATLIESMADERPAVAEDGSSGSKQPPPETPVSAQPLSVMDRPALWTAAPPEAAQEIGKRILVAAGLGNPSETDSRGAWDEILAQSMAGVAASIATHWNCTCNAGGIQPASTAPSGLEWAAFRFSFAGHSLPPVWFAISPGLPGALASAPARPIASPPGMAAKNTAAPDNNAGSQRAPDSSNGANAALPHATANGALPSPNAAAAGSKTFDLLLEVALPVSVSFGRTLLPIRDVLRLTTGSIVELERGVNEPVEVIVNNCVIARGEVVVVDGNYGVRIQRIASRSDRLRTGASSPEAQHALPST